MNRKLTVIGGLGAAVVAAVVAVALLQDEYPIPFWGERFVQLAGVNLAGAEFTPNQVPGRHLTHYIYPAPASVDYFASKGMNVIRLSVLWERLQHQLGDNLDEPEMQLIDAVVNHAALKKMKVILDVHNYAEYYGAMIGSEKVPPQSLGDLWGKIAVRYKGNDAVIFGLMNEPKGLPTETWLAAANAAIAGIRQTGAGNLLLIPGNGWSSARDWKSSKYGTPNSEVMLKAADPRGNSAFEVHQFFDPDFTGSRSECINADDAVENLRAVTKWSRWNRKRAFLGEFGVGVNENCLQALDRVLKFMAFHSDVWMGWTYWAAGPWWPKDYFSSLEPLGGVDRPQMAVLEKYIKAEVLRREAMKR